MASRNLGKNAKLLYFGRLLVANLPLLCILLGSALFSFTLGPFQNWDSNYELQAASGVLKYGVPYTAGPGTMINQPPLGFYIDAPAFRIFGLSMTVGAAIISVFSLGCVVLVYLLGKAFYGSTTGLLASSLFALTPWQAIFSRSFLIDVQCLFFSLLFFLVGFYAFRKDSIRLFTISGAFFAAAFLTKFYGVFMLVPLALLYFVYKPRSLWRPFAVFEFFLPALIFTLLWYKGSIFGILQQDDFKFYNSFGSTPSFFFSFTFLAETLGVFLLVASIAGLISTRFQPKTLRNFVLFDAVCLATLLVVVGLDAFLAVGLNLRAPYNSAIKYDYQALPFFCLTAASLASKFSPLSNLTISGRGRRSLFALFFIGAIGLGGALVSDFYNVNSISRQTQVVFSMDSSVAYTFVNSSPLNQIGPSMGLQYFGFAMVLLGLGLAAKDQTRNKRPSSKTCHTSPPP